MSIRFWLMSVFVLMLLPFSLEAKTVHFTLINDSETADVKDWDSLDEVMKLYGHDINYYF
jgi:hypothetical protein